MISNKQKRDLLRQRRSLRRLTEEERRLRGDLESGRVLPVDSSKIVSRSAVPHIPKYYRDNEFTCKDCGAEEIWTAAQQKWWHEKAGGEIESVAVRCRKCRRLERTRRSKAREVHLAGIVQKVLGNDHGLTH